VPAPHSFEHGRARRGQKPGERKSIHGSVMRDVHGRH
jgi:hypothetical protein